MAALRDIGDEPERTGPQGLMFGDDRGLLRAAMALWLAVTAWKLGLALAGNVVWEESHFAVAGAHPALAYPDVPAGWPLFARLCTELFGWSAPALRIPGLTVAQLIPLAVWWLAEPLVGRRNALWAAIVAMLLPPLTASGTIFYPEGALQLLAAVMLGAAVRAMGSGRLGWWALTGAAGALGLFVHYRFGVIGLGVGLFALLTREGRALWRRPGFWLAGALAAVGLAPALIWNAQEGWPSVAFHAVNRHVWAFNLQGLGLHLLEQFGLCTPVFFLALIGATGAARKAAHDGDARARLLLWTGASVFLLLTALAPLYRTRLPHWPFLAYVPLVPFVPGVVAGFVDRARSLAARRRRALLVGLGGPGFAVLGAVGASLFVLAWADPNRVPVAYRPQLRTQLEDWRALTPDLQAALASTRARFGGEPALAAAGHINAVRLEFPGEPHRRVYALDDPYDETTRFRVMRRAWGLDEAALLREHRNRGVLLVLPEPSYLYHTPAEAAYRRRLCGEFSDIRQERLVELPPGRLAVGLFSARVRPEGQVAGVAGCPLLPALYLARPARAEAVRPGSGENYFGAAADPAGFIAVEVLLDGRTVTRARYGLDPEGSRIDPALSYDPNYPRVQFDFQLPKGLPKGAHRLAIRGVRADGSTVEGAGRTIYVVE